MALINTAVGTANIEQKRVVVDMKDALGYLQPSANPLVVLTKKINTQSTHNYKYEWMANNVDVRWVAAGATATANAVTVVLKAGQGANVAVGDLLKLVKSGEVMKVTAVATDTLTVVRTIGGVGGAVALAVDDAILIVGNASMQGSGAPSENIAGVTPYFNYTQIFKTAFSVTGTLNKTKLYGEAELARLRRNAGIRHAKSIEYAILFGQKSLDTSGAQPITTTEGIYTTLQGNPNNVTKAKAAVTTADMMKFCENIFTYGSSERTCLCSPDILSWFADNATTKLQFVQSDMDKTFGLNITRYMTPHGVLNLILHPLLVTGYSGIMMALDMGDIAYRPLEGRDTVLKTNIQNNDEDGERDMYITEAGVQIELALKHGIFTITA